MQLPENCYDEKILDVIKGYNPSQVGVVDFSCLKFEEKIREFCKQNSCGRYGKSWVCPPGCGSVKELEAECKKYSNAIIFNIVKELKDSFDWDGMMEGGRVLSELINNINEALKNNGFADYRLFGSSSCNDCEECTYPDRPCKFQEKLFTPIEACGINVMETAQKAGLDYMNGQDTVTFFGMLFYN